MISILIVVVLPAPFGPSSPNSSPSLDVEADAAHGLDLERAPAEDAGGGLVGPPEVARLDHAHAASSATARSAEDVDQPSARTGARIGPGRAIGDAATSSPSDDVAGARARDGDTALSDGDVTIDGSARARDAAASSASLRVRAARQRSTSQRVDPDRQPGGALRRVRHGHGRARGRGACGRARHRGLRRARRALRRREPRARGARRSCRCTAPAEAEPTAAQRRVDRPLRRAAGRSPARPNREFRYLVNQDAGCPDVTQFVGVDPARPGAACTATPTTRSSTSSRAGRAPPRTARRRRSRPGSCIHLPPLVVHCLENTGPGADARPRRLPPVGRPGLAGVRDRRQLKPLGRNRTGSSTVGISSSNHKEGESQAAGKVSPSALATRASRARRRRGGRGARRTRRARGGRGAAAAATVACTSRRSAHGAAHRPGRRRSARSSWSWARYLVQRYNQASRDELHAASRATPSSTRRRRATRRAELRRRTDASLAVVGPAGSQEVQAVGPSSRAAASPTSPPSATRTDADDGRRIPTFFRVVPNDAAQGPTDRELHPQRACEAQRVVDHRRPGRPTATGSPTRVQRATCERAGVDGRRASRSTSDDRPTSRRS